ncbi:hypothetical protein IWQ60_010119 [Tieghemiomyces parasiticus]|uniref:Uncharacterized protein n=1 Tax=Tieghemiomyces parasiticus TaxID=78921 RepID=A0A9W7ZVE8_9FUNG|nr:hypothetical protein IWQ60_010119 [Tieghemiomyces parasiticus]
MSLWTSASETAEPPKSAGPLPPLDGRNFPAPGIRTQREQELITMLQEMQDDDPFDDDYDASPSTPPGIPQQQPPKSPPQQATHMTPRAKPTASQVSTTPQMTAQVKSPFLPRTPGGTLPRWYKPRTPGANTAMNTPARMGPVGPTTSGTRPADAPPVDVSSPIQPTYKVRLRHRTDLTGTPSTAFEPEPALSSVASPSKSSASPDQEQLGRWEHPELQRLRQLREARGITGATLKRLQINLGVLIVVYLITSTSVYLAVRRFLFRLGTFPTNTILLIEWAVYGILLFNVAEAAWKFIKPGARYDELSLTPQQRRLVGLDPDVKTSAVSPTSVSPPKYQRRLFGATPRQPPPASTSTVATRSEGSVTVPSRNTMPSATPNPTFTPSARLPFRSIDNLRDLDSMLGPAAIDATPTRPTSMGVANLFSPAPADYSTPFTTRSGRDAPADAGRTFPPLPAYQTASPHSPPYFKDHTRAKSKHNKNPSAWHEAYRFVDARDVLHDELHVSDVDLDQLTENMRRWISVRILEPLVHSIDTVDAELRNQGLGHLTCSEFDSLQTVAQTVTAAAALAPSAASATAAPVAPTPGFGASFGGSTWGAVASRPALGANQNAPPTTLADLATQRFAHEPLAKIRLKLEVYLAVPNHPSRRYVIDRVRALASGGVMAAYRWSADDHVVSKSLGSLSLVSNAPSVSMMSHTTTAATASSAAANGSRDPSDAQLIFHLVCSYLDLISPGASLEANAGRPFSFRYAVQCDVSPDPRQTLQIKQVDRNPPRFVVLAQPQTCLETAPRRDSQFQAWIVFFLLARTRNDGYLGLLNVNAGNFGMDLLLAGTRLMNTSGGETSPGMTAARSSYVDSLPPTNTLTF